MGNELSTTNRPLLEPSPKPKVRFYENYTTYQSGEATVYDLTPEQMSKVSEAFEDPHRTPTIKEITKILKDENRTR